MGRGVDIPWAERVDITWVGGRYTMYRGVKIPLVGRSIYHGLGVDIPWVRVRYTIDRVVDIPWVGGQYTMGRRLIYHG